MSNENSGKQVALSGGPLGGQTVEWSAPDGEIVHREHEGELFGYRKDADFDHAVYVGKKAV